MKTLPKDWIAHERARDREILREARKLTRDPKGLSLDVAGKFLMVWGNERRRMPILHVFMDALPRAAWLELLGANWDVCDNIAAHSHWLGDAVPARRTNALMSLSERARLDSLPAFVTLYRGADRGLNENGLSWTLRREVAARFPFLARYEARNPVLVTLHKVPKSRIVAVKLGRSEDEVIMRRTHDIDRSVERLMP